MLFLYLVLFILILYFVDYKLNHDGIAQIIKIIPGPKDTFFLGNASALDISPVKLFKLGRTWAAQFNGIYRFYAFKLAAVSIYNPEDVEIITCSIKHHEKSVIYKFLKPWLKDGLLVSKGAKWQERRKILTTAFHFNVLRKYFPILEHNSRKLIATLEKTEGQSIDAVPLISEYTLESICETAMGVQLDKDEPEVGSKYKNAVYDTIKLLVKRFVSLYLYSDIIFNLTPDGLKQKRYISTIHNFTKNVINTRKENIKNKEIEEDSDNEDTVDVFSYKKKKKAAMLDLLISAENEGLIDDSGIQEEVDTFMFEGHDTTAAGLTFCLLALAHNPEIQDRVVAELKGIFNDSSRAATPDDMAMMNYLEMCIKEALRLFPPVPFISRKLTETVKLSNYTVPKGTMCHIHIYDLHRHESLYKDALKFDPDRFLPENCVSRHNYAYIPFSAGPRNCIGQKFAMMEMKSALSAILRNFRVEPVTMIEDLEFSADLVLRNSKPVYMKFIKIKS
ncbi:unnamed protein product [Colias eurytheme]|nr:unnamed protein product [Colias eurytheme]